MREDSAATATAAEEPNWFARWEEELPTPEELTPLSQTLITPDLALAFDIPNSSNAPNNPHIPNSTPPAPQFPPSDFDSSDLAGSGGGGGAGDEPARTLKRPRLVWTPQLHKRFVDAVAHLGIKNAVPKTIMQLMSVDGLTRENVASHLQKYRLYLKRMQGLSSGGGGGGGGGAVGPMSAADAATDQLFASGPLPHHFLSRGGPGPNGHGPEPYVPFVPMAALQQHHQMAAVAAAQQFYHQRQQIGGFGTNGGGGFDHGFLTRAQPVQAGLHRVVQPMPTAVGGSYVDDLEERSGGGRKVLTLFPTGED